MAHLLDNPVYNALKSGDAWLSHGTETVKFFDPAVSPFVGFSGNDQAGFSQLFNIFIEGRRILFATPARIAEPKGWEIVFEIPGLQFVFDKKTNWNAPAIQPVPLNYIHVDQMVQLAALTKPGPFDTRTIDFGNYYGIFDNDKLVAMTGQRLHVYSYTEISAVCTDPEHLGKGYASLLLRHQLLLICKNGQVPFLHVKQDNIRAIELYKRLGFTVRSGMNFYFMRRRP